ncbi:nucleotide-diphospho-sugar transferase [Russula aff. rugulosa BPL654]|nr:nucleotide-diphospho-sugar transferase [Russula aff. rugulosa BPL654]
MSQLSIQFLPTKRHSRLLLVAFVALALFSLTLFALQEYKLVDSVTNFISTHKNYQNLGPAILAEGEERDKISASAPPRPHLANATLFMLTRSSDVDGAVNSVREVEDRFNRGYGYPWVFLNEEPFSDDFKRRMSNIVSGPVHFGQIPEEHWYQPDWINETVAAEERSKMVTVGLGYGGSVSYRNMCRFNSGFFFRHPLVQQFRYYWRVEPDVHFYCDVNFDPFVYMQENNKLYGFTISVYDDVRTMKSLWSTVRDFMHEHPEHIVPNNAMDFLSDNNGTDYNLCLFYNNFEIGDLEFWHSEAYSAYFEYLDKQGGFYYERWGDAPVHTIAAALLAGTDRIHFFREIGYEHHPFIHCPAESDIWERGRCACTSDHNSDYESRSCLPRWDRLSQFDP